MVAVDMRSALLYGFRLLGYLLLVFIAGGILIAIGASFAPDPFSGSGNAIMMVIFYLAGFAVIYAGSLGLLYKVIGDGVEIGNIAAETSPSGAPPQGGGQPPAQGRGQPAAQGGAQTRAQQPAGQQRGRQQGTRQQ